ncbi:hypothetical protein GGS21DRAFT_488872 [Xylaria nigripes]|nr:hypothetical protein GGS21DRAFT_488872 [Xylaria nigripes]
MLFSVGRVATRRLASTAFATRSARLFVLRGTAKNIYGYSPLIVRTFAAAKKLKATSESKDSKEAVAKKPVKKTTAKKPAKKATKTTKAAAKGEKKAKAKAKPKVERKKAPLSPEKKLLLQRRALRNAALFTEPKRLPEAIWVLYVFENLAGTKQLGGASQRTSMLSAQYKTLSDADKQRLLDQCKKNKAINAEKYKAWVESHTPQQIIDASRARRQLKKKFGIPKAKVNIIRDFRMPSRPPSAFSLFTKSRWASGDFTSSSITESGRRIGAEWKALSDADRQAFVKLAEVASERYEQGVKLALGSK